MNDWKPRRGRIRARTIFYEDESYESTEREPGRALPEDPMKRSVNTIPPAAISTLLDASRKLSEVILGECNSKHTLHPYEKDLNADYHVTLTLSIGEARAFLQAVESAAGGPKPHNPDALSAEQIDAAAGWRLLNADEIAPPTVDKFPLLQEVETWAYGVWRPGSLGILGECTYRTKLTPGELVRKRMNDK